jgi:hypothetical protein
MLKLLHPFRGGRGRIGCRLCERRLVILGDQKCIGLRIVSPFTFTSLRSLDRPSRWPVACPLPVSSLRWPLFVS